MKAKHLHLASFLLRIGIASVFLYAAVSSFLDPLSWIGFFPNLLTNLFPATFLLVSWSLFEIALALWLLSGKKIFYSALLASVTLFFIMVGNLGALDVIFRDFAIFCAALALTMLAHEGD